MINNFSKVQAFGRFEYFSFGNSIPSDPHARTLLSLVDSTNEELTGEHGAPRDEIVMIRAGSYHVLLLTSSGDVYGAGWSDYGQYVRSGSTDTLFAHMKFEQKVKTMITKFNFTLFILEDGSAIGSGWNGYNVLSSNSSTSKKNIAYLPDLKFIGGGAGGSHVFMIDTMNRLWTSGWNQYGQCGLGHMHSIQSPEQLDHTFDGARIVAIDGGYSHTLFLDSFARVWACGKNSEGQLGLGTIESMVTTPRLIDQKYFGNERIVQISCGEEHSGFLTETGVCFLSGDSSNQSTSGNKYIPSKFPIINLKQISLCGFHTMALSMTNVLYCRGDLQSSEFSPVTDHPGIYQLQLQVNFLTEVVIMAGRDNGYILHRRDCKKDVAFRQSMLKKSTTQSFIDLEVITTDVTRDI